MRCIVVDDEPLARQGMELNIENINFLEHLGSFGTAIQAANFITQNKVDLMFLDIEMPGLSGLEFLRSNDNNTLTILTTAYPQYALEAFELDVLDYLVKPIRFERFFKAVNRAKSLFETQNKEQHYLNEVEEEFCYIKSERRILKIFWKDIIFIKGLKDYVIIHTGEDKFLTAMNIKTILGQLPDKQFARVSKSYIINVDRINEMTNDTIYIEEQEIPLSKAYKEDFMTYFITDRLLKR